jgi:hypothetical protein
MRNTIISLEKSLSSFSGFGKYEWIRLDNLLDLVSNWITIIPSQQYRLLGIHGKGEGLFVRETKYGSSIKAKKLNQCLENWFIYSRLFARHGSFAIVENEFSGGCASNEFPTFKVKTTDYEPVELLNYIIFYLNTPPMLAFIESQCTGQTKVSRARFKEEQFLNTSIPIPADNDILKTVNTIRSFQHLAKKLSINSNYLPTSIETSFPMENGEKITE